MSKREREQELWEERQDAMRELRDRAEMVENELDEGHAALDRLGVARTIPDSDGAGISTLTIKGRILALRAEVPKDEPLLAELSRLREIMHLTQVTLTALNVGNIQSESLLHNKLRETMIAYREVTEAARERTQ